MTAIDVDVHEVLKGAWKEPQVGVVLFGDPRAGTFFTGTSYDYEAGEDVIFFLHYQPGTLGGVFLLGGDGDSLIESDDRWVTRGKSAKTVQYAEIEKQARLAGVGSMCAAADAVAVGSIEELHLQEFDCGVQTKCTADYATIRVHEAWKGVESGETILVRTVRRGTNLSWYAPVPLLAVGESYLMFLKKDSSGFYPFMGFNGFLRVDGERLIVNGHLEYPIPIARVRAELAQEVGK